MNKVVIVGLLDQKLSELETLLIQCGMNKALPSNMGQLEASAVVNSIYTAHDLQVDFEKEILPLAVAPIWSSLLMDLILANHTQKIWGWADSKVIYLLDYLKQQDDGFFFVLVYDSPENFLFQETNKYLDEEELEARRKEWINYNTFLKQFYTENKERCILVHATQMQESLPECVEKISAKLGLTIPEIRVESPVEVKKSSNVKGRGNARRQKKEAQQQIKYVNPLQVPKELLEQTNHEANGLEFFKTLLADIGEDFTKDMQFLFSELQTESDCALAVKPLTAHSVVDIWNMLNQNEEMLESQKEALDHQQHHTFKLEGEYQKLEGECQNLKLELQKLNSQRVESEKINLQLEDQLNQNLIEKKKIENTAIWRKKRMSELSALNKASEHLQEENEILLLQLQKLQEAYELCVTELNKKLAQIRQYEKAQLEQYLAIPKVTKVKATKGAALVVKQSPEYKIGALLIDHSHRFSDIVVLPVVLYKEIKQYSPQDLRTVNNLDAYEDAYEGERMKNHLSYRLGKKVVSCLGEKQPLSWTKLPLELSKEIFSFKMKKTKV